MLYIRCVKMLYSIIVFVLRLIHILQLLLTILLIFGLLFSNSTSTCTHMRIYIYIYSMLSCVFVKQTFVFYHRILQVDRCFDSVSSIFADVELSLPKHKRPDRRKLWGACPASETK